MRVPGFEPGQRAFPLFRQRFERSGKGCWEARVIPLDHTRISSGPTHGLRPPSKICNVFASVLDGGQQNINSFFKCFKVNFACKAVYPAISLLFLCHPANQYWDVFVSDCSIPSPFHRQYDHIAMLSQFFYAWLASVLFLD